MLKVLNRAVAGAAVVAAAALLSAASGRASAATAEETRNRQVITQAFDAWRAGTGGPYDLLADDARWTITGNSLAAGLYPNREAFMSKVIRPFNARLSQPLKPTVRKLYAEGDTVIAFFDAAGTASDGKPYQNTYAWFLRMKEGRIVESHAFFDSLTFDDFWRRITPSEPTP